MGSPIAMHANYGAPNMSGSDTAECCSRQDSQRLMRREQGPLRSEAEHVEITDMVVQAGHPAQC